LLPAVLYELLRQLAPARTALGPDATSRTGALRSEHAEHDRDWPHPHVTESDGKSWDPVPINYAFTCSGLQALKIDKMTLASFPDVFKEGMAARADRLGDTGPSAPEHWDGVLGLDSVHGYFTGGYVATSDTLPVLEDWRRHLRRDVHE